MRFDQPRRFTFGRVQAPPLQRIASVFAAVTSVFAAVASVFAAVAIGACAPVTPPDEGNVTPVEFPSCAPNLDGRITRDELLFVQGATARVRISRDVAVSVSGEAGQGSARVWDLTRPDPEEDELGLLTVEPMEGHWFDELFPGAQLAGPLVPSSDGASSILGPLSISDDGVVIHGSASRDEAPTEGKTLLAYEEPVLLYPFPLEMGTHAETVTQALNGVARGIPLAIEDTYTVDVSAHGEVRLPDLILEDALRVTLRLERVPVAGLSVQQVTHVFLNECVGEVARIVSPFAPLTDDLPDEFETAAEMWRLSF
jgi:hypothetical protein